MPLHPTYLELALRLAVTVVAGVLIGLNRTEEGHPVGMRTVLLVALAAAVSMIQVNLLLSLAGKPANSFIVMDLMRLPLGILSGIGFIGAGAIMRRGDAVKGITTAATIWFVTVMGLCLGGGQIGLGVAALALGLFVLQALKHIENRIPIDHRATVRIAGQGAALAELGVVRQLSEAGYHVKERGLRYTAGGESAHLLCDVRWRGGPKDTRPPHELIRKLAAEEGVEEIDWQN